MIVQNQTITLALVCDIRKGVYRFTRPVTRAKKFDMKVCVYEYRRKNNRDTGNKCFILRTTVYMILLEKG